MLLQALTGSGQDVVRDTTKKSDIYGLRVGIDLSRPLLTLLNEDYQGLEIVGDYRISEHLYLAAELGNESRRVEEVLDNADGINRITLYDIESAGSYLKLGVDYNTYTNWYGMNNSILIGARYAFSTFKNTLDNYRYFDSNRYWSPNDFVAGSEFVGEYTGLNASWLELLAGVKADGKLDNQRDGDPNTGNFIDCFGNKMRVLAVANPNMRWADFNEGQVDWYVSTADRSIPSEGYGIIRVNQKERTALLECWERNTNPATGEQFPGWPYLHRFDG